MDKNLVRRLLLGVTGGIAAYKVAELSRLLQRNNVEVQVAMTEAATKFVTPATFQALTGRPVVTDLWDASFPNHMAHIELSRGVDAILIAPASADFMAKLANGLADDVLSTTCLARNCPLLVAPAMNREMWDNPATQRNVATLRGDGVTLLGPGAGDQACGEVGMGRMLEPEELLAAVMELARRALAEEMKARDSLASPAAVRGYLRLHMQDLGHETFYCVFLDAQNRVIAASELFRGTLTQTSVYPREVVKHALKHNAAAVILAHNQPSGVAEPSIQDQSFTRTLAEALALVDVKVLDHFIVAPGACLSFAERGLL